MLSKTPAFNKGEFDDAAIFTKDDLADFAKTCVKLKDHILTQLEITVRRDVMEKPTQQLGALLKKVGLATELVEQKNVGSGKSYQYRLNPTLFERIKTIVDYRSDPSQVGWSYIDQNYGFSYTADQLDLIYRS